MTFPTRQMDHHNSSEADLFREYALTTSLEELSTAARSIFYSGVLPQDHAGPLPGRKFTQSCPVLTKGTGSVILAMNSGELEVWPDGHLGKRPRPCY